MPTDARLASDPSERPTRAHDDPTGPRPVTDPAAGAPHPSTAMPHAPYEAEPWEESLAALTDLVAHRGPLDFTDDRVMAGSDLVWARTQQREAASLPATARHLLEQVPGWRWMTNVDRLAAGDLPGLRVVAYRERSDEAALAKIVHLLPVAAVQRMAVADDPAAARVNAALRAAADERVHELGVRLDTLLLLLPAPARSEQNIAYLVALLDTLATPDSASRALRLLVAHQDQRADLREALRLGVQSWPTTDQASVLGVSAGPLPPALTVAIDDPATPLSGPGPEEGSAAHASFERLGQRHIATLRLSARTHNVLVREGLTRIADVLAIEDPNELLNLRGFGHTCLDNLRQQLHEHDLVPLF